MIDLETWDVHPTAAINALAVVIFDRAKILETHYLRVDAQSCIEAGLTVDMGTVHWWMQQGDAARLEVIKRGVNLGTALDMLSYWLSDPCDGIWGNGPTFDVSILENAYRAMHMKAPWEFWRARCLRTLAAEHPDIERVSRGTAHNALSDARSQALQVLKIWAKPRKGART